MIATKYRNWVVHKAKQELSNVCVQFIKFLCMLLIKLGKLALGYVDCK